MTDAIDVLGPRPERREAFTRELLSETDDAELQRIVAEAAQELSAPIALVSLVLDQIQFFRAHYGLPADLAAARGTRRDVSFCQFVVRDGQPFEVADAPNDPRVPQHLVEAYHIQSYLGIPVRARDTVVGSLCVIDTKARRFSDEERNRLAKLAALVNERLSALTEGRRRVRLDLTESAAGPALLELRESLSPIRGSAEAGLPALAAIRAFLRLSAHVAEGGETRSDALRRSLEAAVEALDTSEDAFYDIETAADDCEDCVLALEQLTTQGPPTPLSQVTRAAQDLARQSTRPVGGAPLPEFHSDPLVHAPQALAVALVTTGLTTVAARLAEAGGSDGIRIEFLDRGSRVELAISAEGLSAQAIDAAASALAEQIGRDPSVSVHAADGALRLGFVVADGG